MKIPTNLTYSKLKMAVSAFLSLIVISCSPARPGNNNDAQQVFGDSQPNGQIQETLPRGADEFEERLNDLRAANSPEVVAGEEIQPAPVEGEQDRDAEVLLAPTDVSTVVIVSEDGTTQVSVFTDGEEVTSIGGEISETGGVGVTVDADHDVRPSERAVREEPSEVETTFTQRSGFVFNFEDPNSSLLLRAEPSISGEVLERLPLMQNNDEVTEVLVTGIANEDYYSATYNSVEGFVGRNHITFDREEAEDEIQEIIAQRPAPPEPGDVQEGKAAISLTPFESTCSRIKERAQAGAYSQTRVNSEATYYVMPILPHINRDSRNHLNCINVQGKCIVRTGDPSNDVVHNIRTGLYDYTTEDRTEMRCKFGYGNRSNCLDPCTTIAADQDHHSRGTVVYIPHMEGRICPQNGQPVSGCFVVDDIGGGINGWARFDFFQGECLNYDYANSVCLDDYSNDFITGVNRTTLYILPRNNELAEELKEIRENHVDNSWNYTFP